MDKFIEINIVSGITEVDPTDKAEDLTENNADFAIDCANSVRVSETWKVNKAQFSALHEAFGIDKLTKYVIKAYESRLDGIAGQIYYVGFDNELTENLSECDLYDTEADCETEIERIKDSFASCWELKAEEVQDYELEELEC